MKRFPARVTITDHVVLRYLERAFDLDVAAVRRHLERAAQEPAELGAVAVQIEKVKLLLCRNGGGEVSLVTVVGRSSTSAVRTAEDHPKKRRRGGTP